MSLFGLGGGDDPFMGPGGIFGQFAQGVLGPGRRRPASQYSEYLKAYSVAMLPGNERANVSYGGKIIMPPSALANLTALDLESPWMFKLSNPQNPAAFTHAGVLEFIAEEGAVHLPYWMMKSLRINEGDTIRITGAELPKGRFVKLQPQSVHFLEISDHKAVLEMALRNFSALTQGDTIQISYNSIVFDLLIMEVSPPGSGINVVDTDLEVDFAPPPGYKEPERPKAAPPSTMASKLNIDLSSSTPGSSRPPSSVSGAFAGVSQGQPMSKNGEKWESFKGRGETLSGRKTKGRGISQRPAEARAEGSRAFDTKKPRIVSNDMLEADVSAPAPLNLPHGKLFFGFRVVPYQRDSKQETDEHTQGSKSFGETGNTLSGRSVGDSPSSAKAQGKMKATGKENDVKNWGKGRTLNGDSAGSAIGDDGRAWRSNTRSKGKQVQRERSPTPDWGVESDEEPIIIDSD